MTFTFIGVIQIMIGVAILLFGSLRSAFILLVVSGLFSGSAVIALPALGGSTIPPFHFALAFILIRILIPGGGYLGLVPEAIKTNRWFVLFTLYGVAGAYLLPRLFENEISVFPMYFAGARSMFDTTPLHPTPQNITQTFYLVGALLAGICAYIFGRTRDAGKSFISAALWVGWLHIAVGLFAVAVRGTPIDAFLELFRNGNYEQMDAQAGQFVRIRGIFPETSTYTTFAFGYFVLAAELWYRSIRPRATGWLAFAMAVTLFFSTSSTAYVGLALYLAFFILRFILFPGVADTAKAVKLAVAIGGIAFVMAAVMAIVPHLPAQIFDVVERMTVGKSDSDSGRQRLFLALQGWRLLFESYGLGVGIGSFRSSSFVTALLGSTGVIGMATFTAYLLQFLQPWKKSTWSGWQFDENTTMGSAFASAAFLTLIPLAIASAEANPGVHFAILAGMALALRPVGQVVQEREDVTFSDSAELDAVRT